MARLKGRSYRIRNVFIKDPNKAQQDVATKATAAKKKAKKIKLA
jgi:hypothetical protein